MSRVTLAGNGGSTFQAVGLADAKALGRSIAGGAERVQGGSRGGRGGGAQTKEQSGSRSFWPNHPCLGVQVLGLDPEIGGKLPKGQI